jgi:hypothetical protein
VNRRDSKTRWAGIIAVPLILFGVTGRAEAQDARVRVVIPDDVIREVIRSVDRIVTTDLGPQIDAAIRTATRGDFHLGDLRALRDIQNRDRDFRVTQEARETKTLKLGAAGALEVRNMGGNVTVSAVSGGDATIDIVRTSRGRTDADAKLGLEKVTVDVDQRGDRATLTVQYPDDNRPPYAVSTAFHVKAPAGTRITINSLGGNITVTDITGDISTSTHGGNTTITNGRNVAVKSLGGTIALTGIESDGTVQAETYGGDLDLKQIKARRLQASTLGGNVFATDITSDGADLGTMGGNVTFGGTLSKNGRYELHTAGGDVRFIPAGGVGFELQASTFSGEIRTEGVTLQMQGAVSNRGINRNLRATVGDAGALVILRTLSGNVIVGKR